MGTRDNVDVFAIRGDRMPATARVLTLRGNLGVSRLYQIEALIVVGRADADWDPDGAVMNRATVEVMRADGTPRSQYHGVAASVEFIRDFADDAVYRVVLVPEVFKLTLTRRSRVFCEGTPPDTVPDIVEQLLHEHGIADANIARRLARNYSALPHTCQYRESDWDFVARLLEREGICFFFEMPADTGVERLVLCDNKGQHPALDGHVRFFPSADDGGQAEAMESWRGRHAVIPTTVKPRDWDPMLPDIVEAEEPANDTGDALVTSWGENFVGDAGKRVAQNRAGEFLSRKAVFHGRGRLFDLLPGYTFELEEHPRPAYNQKYLLTEVELRGNQFAAFPEMAKSMGFSDDRTWVVDASAIPEAQQFRPQRRTHVPRIYGVESALIDGPAESDYAQLDDHGRYKVKVLFDEGDLDGGKASLWVRMLQPHGGNPEGHHFPLRKGTEVMLVFLGGDPDRPVIAGVAPNAANPSVVTSENHTHNVIHTGGNNRFEIEDLDESQYIDISTPPEKTFIHLGKIHGPHDHNWIMKTNGSGLLHTGGNEDVFVGGKLTEHVVGDVEENYDSNQDSTIMGDRSRLVFGTEVIDILGDQAVFVLGNQDHIVVGNRTHEVDGSETVKVLSGQDNTVLAGQKNKVIGGQQNTIVGGQKNMIVGGQASLIIGSHQTTVMGSQTNSILGSQNTLILGGGTVISPPGYTIIAPGGYKVVGADWFKTAAKSGELIGLKLSFYGIKSDMGGVAIAVNGAKVDIYASKADNGPLKLSNVGIAMKNGAIRLASAGLRLAKAGLHLLM